MVSQAQVVVRTDHDTTPTVSDHVIAVGRLNGAEEWIKPGILNALGVLKRLTLVEQVVHGGGLLAEIE
jgi:hypothetical protein